MAEDIRIENSDPSLTEGRRMAVIIECRRQEESCLWTSTTLFIWLRWVRFQRQFFIAAPIIIGGIAGLSVLKAWTPDWVIALLAFVASLFPALATALKFETRVEEIAKHASDFKSLQDRFRQIANITAPVDVKEAEIRLADLMDRLDAARSKSITTPEWAFARARKKIGAGHYSFTIDEQPVEKG
jgi:hypothetical protein